MEPNKILNTTCARCVDHITNSQLRIYQNVQIKLKLVILKHIVKGIVKLIGNFLDLELLTVDLILNVINPEVQFGDVHLSVFIASLSNLESLHKCVDFVLELLFPLLSFLGRNLKLFHVLTNSFQFLFNIPELIFSQFSSLIASLQFILLNSQFPGQFIKFLFVVRCHLGCFPHIFVSLLNLNFIVHGFVLKELDLLQDSISLLGGKSKFGDSLSQAAISFLCLFLHKHDTTTKSTDLLLSIFEVLFSLLKSSKSFIQFVICFIKIHLVALDFLAQISDISFMLINTLV